MSTASASTNSTTPPAKDPSNAWQFTSPQQQRVETGGSALMETDGGPDEEVDDGLEEEADSGLDEEAIERQRVHAEEADWRHTHVEEAHRWRALRMMRRRSARAQHRVELKQVVLEEEEGRRRFSRWRKVRGRRFSGSRVAELIFWGLDPEAAGDENFWKD
jgi:hypothetical protein